jgi:hypothetical protein
MEEFLRTTPFYVFVIIMLVMGGALMAVLQWRKKKMEAEAGGKPRQRGIIR